MNGIGLTYSVVASKSSIYLSLLYKLELPKFIGIESEIPSYFSIHWQICGGGSGAGDQRWREGESGFRTQRWFCVHHKSCFMRVNSQDLHWVFQPFNNHHLVTRIRPPQLDNSLPIALPELGKQMPDFPIANYYMVSVLDYLGYYIIQLEAF